MGKEGEAILLKAALSPEMICFFPVLCWKSSNGNCDGCNQSPYSPSQ